MAKICRNTTSIKLNSYLSSTLCSKILDSSRESKRFVHHPLVYTLQYQQFIANRHFSLSTKAILDSSYRHITNLKLKSDLSSTLCPKIVDSSNDYRRLVRHPLATTIPRQQLIVNRHLSMSTKAILDSSPRSIQPYLRLIRFDKPIGTYLLFWPCTWSIAMAADPGHLPSLYYLAIFGAGSFVMRSAGCIINDMWDKDFDKMVERTKMRPLASGELSQLQALGCLGLHLSAALGLLLQFNNYSILLGAASLGLVITYPLAKRYTYWPQVMLGLTFNYGVLLGWSAVKGYTDWSVLLPMYVGCLAWTLTYDTIYAHQDKYDDMLIGVKSTALKLGNKTKPWLAGFSTTVIGGLAVSGFMCEQTWPFYAGLGVTAAHLIHQVYTVDLEDNEDLARKFKSNTHIGAIMFLAIVFGTLLKQQGSSLKEREDAADISNE